jgi:MerR family transcriptional regulator, repressor of the yfmOP operon
MTAPALIEPRLRIGEVASRVGITARTIRYYEELGLLGASSERQKGGHRFYSDSDVGRLTELVRLRDLLGLSLEELAVLTEAEDARAALRDRWSETASDAERLRIVEEALIHVGRQLELVRARSKRLAEFAAELEAKLESLNERQDDLRAKGTR